MHNSAFYKSRWTAGQRISIFSNDVKLGSYGSLELYHNTALVLSSHNPLTTYAMYSENHLVTSPISLFQNMTSILQVSSSKKKGGLKEQNLLMQLLTHSSKLHDHVSFSHKPNQLHTYTDKVNLLDENITTVKESAEAPFVTRMMLVCKSMQGKLQAYSVLMFSKQTAEQNHFI